MSSVASTRSPGREQAHDRLAHVFGRLEVARADARAETIGERDAQQRIGLQLRRGIQDAGAHPQRSARRRDRR